MRQEKYLEKAISKLEKDLKKAGLSDMYTINSRIQDRTPILDIFNNESGTEITYSLANAYIMYLEEDVSAAESFKDTRKNIMEDIRRDHPIEVQAEETFPLQNPFVDIGGITSDNIQAIDFSHHVDHSGTFQNENQEDVEENQNEPDNIDRIEQEYRSFNANTLHEFSVKMKEFFEWMMSRDPLAPLDRFRVSENTNLANCYLENNHAILINLTDAYNTYRDNNQDFFDFATDLYADYEEQLSQHRQQNGTLLVIHEQDDLELEHEYYNYETREETNMPDLNETSYDRMQEFDDYDTNYESEFASKMKELFEWKEPETSFALRSENGVHNLYVGETGIVINLTEANERYQTNSQSFLEIGLDLFNNEYKERLTEQIRERAQNGSDEEKEIPNKEEDLSEIDTEEYDDDYFPF